MTAIWMSPLVNTKATSSLPAPCFRFDSLKFGAGRGVVRSFGFFECSVIGGGLSFLRL